MVQMRTITLLLKFHGNFRRNNGANEGNNSPPIFLRKTRGELGWRMDVPLSGGIASLNPRLLYTLRFLVLRTHLLLNKFYQTTII